MAASSRYGISLKQLRELMEHRGMEGVQRVGLNLNLEIIPIR